MIRSFNWIRVLIAVACLAFFSLHASVWSEDEDPAQNPPVQDTPTPDKGDDEKVTKMPDPMVGIYKETSYFEENNPQKRVMTPNMPQLLDIHSDGIQLADGLHKFTSIEVGASPDTPLVFYYVLHVEKAEKFYVLIVSPMWNGQSVLQERLEADNSIDSVYTVLLAPGTKL